MRWQYNKTQTISIFLLSSLLLIENIDAYILNIAIPKMAEGLNTNVFVLKLAITSYLIGLAVFIPISGWIADRFGTRKVLLFSISLFSLMSLFCALSQNVVFLVLSRLFQGVAGAFMVPVARIILLKTFDKTQMVRASIIMGLPVMLGPIIAPIIGGAIINRYSWRLIFLVNLPLGLIAFYLALRYIVDYREKPGGFAFRSFVFLALALTCISFGIDLALVPQVNMRLKSFLFITSLFFFIIYYYFERLSQNPVIKYSLFKLRTFNLSFWSSLIVRMALGGRSFIIALYLELAMHLNPLHAGTYFTYVALGMLSSRSVCRILLNRYGYKKVLTLANSTSFIALLGLAYFNPLAISFKLCLFINGLASAGQFIALNTLYYAEVRREDYSFAVSIINTWQQLSASLGIIIAAGFLHFFHLLAGGVLSSGGFKYTFLALAVLNLLAQVLINRLNNEDGAVLLNKSS